MKIALLSLAASTSIFPLSADILVNGDFSEGTAHWRGDAHVADADPSDPGSKSSGIVIQLKKDKWTHIFQVFRARNSALYYSIGIKLSLDYKIPSPTDAGDHVITGPRILGRSWF